MIVGIKSIQDQGKTLTGVALVRWLVTEGGYAPGECYGNVALSMPGFNRLNSNGMRELMGQMVTGQWRHKVLFIDEINRVYPARMWKDPERTGELLTMWQDEKCFHWIIYTCHVGTSVDILIREATQIIIVPKYRKERDIIELEVINSLDLEVHSEVIERVSRFFTDYDRWEIVS